MPWSELQAEPAFGFTVVGLIIVFGPLLAERVRLPGVLGLLVLGALIGPNMLEVLPGFGTLQAVGDIGVLYLIFLSGLQLDLDAFRANWRTSAGFGALTSAFPLVLGTWAASLAGLDVAAALLVGSFWASFTLIAYPIITRYGLTKNRAVSAVVGASSITDTVSLVILALIVGSETGDVGGIRLVIELAFGFAVLVAFCFGVAPLVARWFFAGLGQERTLRFMLVLVSLTSAAVIADAVGVEPLIGAFFVGVGLNRRVPNASPLMSVTEFFGNAFFIPAFLVSVGLLFDPQVMVKPSTLKLAIGFTAALIVGKLIAALLTGRIFRLDPAETGLLFSVSVAQAAATLAATIVGLQSGLYGEDVVNAVMVVVSVSLIVTSVGTERFAKRVTPPAEHRPPLGNAVLIPIGRAPATLRPVLGLADQIASDRAGVIHPVVVGTSTDAAAVEQARTTAGDSDRMLLALGRDAGTIMRLDRSVAIGIQRAAIECGASMLLLDWPLERGLRTALFGRTIAEIVAETALPTAAVALHDEPWRRVVLVVRPSDLLPARIPAVVVAAELARAVSDGDRPLSVGPVEPATICELGAELPEQAAHVEREGSLGDFLSAVTHPGDLVIAPVVRAPHRWLLALHESGRSIVAVSHNPTSETTLSGSALSFPVGGSITPG